MSRRVSFLIGMIVLVALAAFSSPAGSRAESAAQPDLAGSPVDLINAVNALRTSYGRVSYTVNSILMGTAQRQADFLASTGHMTHTGPGGIGVTERLLAAGYPLAGDLSLGGFRSENITGGPESMSAQAAVNAWMGDAPHLDTMISPNLSEIGAGVAVKNGKVYYVIDAAQPTARGEPQVAATSLDGGSAVPTRDPNAVISPVALSTPNAEGDVVHEVKSGQTLWQIAIAYQIKVDEIKSMNGLSGNDIYPGNKLLIKKGAPAPTAFLTETATQAAAFTSTSVPTWTVTPSLVATSTPIVVASSVIANNSMIMKVIIGAIALGLIGGGMVAWLGDGRKK